MKSTKELKYGLLFASPVLLGYLIFVVFPIVSTLYFSMTSYRVGSAPEWVGFENYARLFRGADPFFYPAVKATVYYVGASVPSGVVLAFILALLLNRKIRGRAFFRGVFFMPVVIPLAASCMVWLWLLQPDFGIVNEALRSLGLPRLKWLADPATVVPTLVLFNGWTVGNMMVIFLAGLQAIPVSLYEAVEIDGGNAWHKLVYVTIPMSSPILFFNTVVGLINGFQTFVQPVIMTQGGPNNASLLYVLYLYNEAFRYSRMGSASAIAVLLFAVVALLTAFFFAMSRSWVYYEAGRAER